VQLAFNFKKTGYNNIDSKLNSIYRMFITRMIFELRKVEPNITDNENGKLIVKEIETITGYQYQITQSKKYASYFEMGTGIYGPSGKKIVPINEKLFINEKTQIPIIRVPYALSWNNGGTTMFAKSSKGIKPTHPFINAIKKTPKIMMEVMADA